MRSLYACAVLVGCLRCGRRLKMPFVWHRVRSASDQPRADVPGRARRARLCFHLSYGKSYLYLILRVFIRDQKRGQQSC